MEKDRKSGFSKKQVLLKSNAVPRITNAGKKSKDTITDLRKGKKLSEIEKINATQKKLLFKGLMKYYINNLENKKHIYYFILPSMIRIDNNQINVEIIGESEYRKIKNEAEKSKNNIDSCFIDPKFSFESDCKNLNLSYSIGTFILKYHLNFNNDDIKDFFKNNKQIPNKQVNDLLKMAFDIKIFISIDYLNELEQFIDGFELIDKNSEQIVDLKSNKLNNNNLNNNLQEKIKNKCKTERCLEIDENKYNDLRICHSVKDKKNDLIDDLPRCPNCLNYAIIEGGCNFITCHSVYCKGSKFFCKICNKKLLYSEKINHFPKGVFDNSCKNTIIYI